MKKLVFFVFILLRHGVAGEITLVKGVLDQVNLTSAAITGIVQSTTHPLTCEINSHGVKRNLKFKGGEPFSLNWGEHARFTKRAFEMQILSVSPGTGIVAKANSNLNSFSIVELANKWPTVKGFVVQTISWRESGKAETNRIFITASKTSSLSLIEEIRSALGVQASMQDNFIIAGTSIK